MDGFLSCCDCRWQKQDDIEKKSPEWDIKIYFLILTQMLQIYKNQLDQEFKAPLKPWLSSECFKVGIWPLLTGFVPSVLNFNIP